MIYSNDQRKVYIQYHNAYVRVCHYQNYNICVFATDTVKTYYAVEKKCCLKLIIHRQTNTRQYHYDRATDRKNHQDNIIKTWVL